jgi:hypothetical protein
MAKTTGVKGIPGITEAGKKRLKEMAGEQARKKGYKGPAYTATASETEHARRSMELEGGTQQEKRLKKSYSS